MYLLLTITLETQGLILKGIWVTKQGVQYFIYVRQCSVTHKQEIDQNLEVSLAVVDITLASNPYGESALEVSCPDHVAWSYSQSVAPSRWQMPEMKQMPEIVCVKDTQCLHL